MGMLTKSKRGENDPLTFSLDNMDFSISLDNVNKIKLNEKSVFLLKKAILNNCTLNKNNKKIVIGDEAIFIDEAWSRAFNKLLDSNLIVKASEGYNVTDKGLKHYNSLT
ncbi:MAG: hypothetical protein PUA73_04215 [Bacilli bacterium]|nr:hypothetical protein [Bacilli bacterium]